METLGHLPDLREIGVNPYSPRRIPGSAASTTPTRADEPPAASAAAGPVTPPGTRRTGRPITPLVLPVVAGIAAARPNVLRANGGIAKVLANLLPGPSGAIRVETAARSVLALNATRPAVILPCPAGAGLSEALDGEERREDGGGDEDAFHGTSPFGCEAGCVSGFRGAGVRLGPPRPRPNPRPRSGGGPPPRRLFSRSASRPPRQRHPPASRTPLAARSNSRARCGSVRCGRTASR